ncbi:MAG: sugar phosphate nucleotidyltransferase, partial [Pseudomonadota bacterium]
MIDQAMILAAGLGTRMQYLTKDIPKPMISVNGISLIERHLQYLYKNKISKLVINTHYKAEVFEEFVKSLEISKKFELYFSREKDLLGTAGGVKNALSFLGKDPFFVINSDSIFVDQESAFDLLEARWDRDYMPMLMLLAKKDKAFGYWAKGDFDMDAHGRLNQNDETRDFINPGMYLMDYKLFDSYKNDVLQFYPEVFKDL